MKKQKLSSVYGEMKLTKHDIIKRFQEYNREHEISYGFQPSDVPELSAIIVFKQSNFTRSYPERSRSYRVTSQSGKIFFDGMLGGSMYGDCLDGTDQGVRLDAYNWEVEFCYYESEVSK